MKTCLTLAAAVALGAAVSCACGQRMDAPHVASRVLPNGSCVVSGAEDALAVVLTGNVHPMARPEFETGAATAAMRLDGLMLLLKPGVRRQRELDALLEAQQNPASPWFHRWLKPDEYGLRFGAGREDMARVQGWLEGQGFTVERILGGRQLVLFSGTVEQVAQAFHVELRRYRVDGLEHIANAEDPQIPAALAGIVSGVVSLHDFRRTAAMGMHRRLGARPQWNLYGSHYLFPADMAAIYDLNPLYSGGIDGAGVSIAIAGRSNIALEDVAAFRAAAGLPPARPAVLLAGADPGLVNGEQDEATLDVEWAGAIAPAASVTLVASASTVTTDGVDLAAAYIVSEASAQVVSVSYGSCEQAMGATELAFYDGLWKQAASEGMSVFVASGDSGAAGCELGTDARGSAAAVNGLCSSPYATCVGGTQFDEGSNAGQYWSETNGANQGSALGYIPEAVWNESGASGGAGLWASGGGASAVYAQPWWQRGVTGTSAANEMRAVPDVSLTAARHDGYIMEENGVDWIVSGTSAAAPSFAAMMALLVQKQGGHAQGNANPGLYALLNAVGNPFHATAAGNNAVPGVAGFYATGDAFNLATGLGSVDGTGLVNSWGLGTAGPAPVERLKARSTPQRMRARRGL